MTENRENHLISDEVQVAHATAHDDPGARRIKCARCFDWTTGTNGTGWCKGCYRAVEREQRNIDRALAKELRAWAKEAAGEHAAAARAYADQIAAEFKAIEADQKPRITLAPGWTPTVARAFREWRIATGRIQPRSGARSTDPMPLQP